MYSGIRLIFSGIGSALYAPTCAFTRFTSSKQNWWSFCRVSAGPTSATFFTATPHAHAPHLPSCITAAVMASWLTRSKRWLSTLLMGMLSVCTRMRRSPRAVV